MASAPSGLSSSASASTTLPTMVTASLLVNTSLLLLSNMSSMMTAKLDYGNYIVWKHQIEVILDTYSMIDVLDDSISAPDRFLKDSSGNFTVEVNPTFIAWKNREQYMFTFLNSTLSPAILPLTVGQKSARGVWKVLEKRFAFVSRSHVMNLRNELKAIKKGVDSIYGYFQKIKQARDRLVAVSVFVDDEELLHIILDGLPSEYDSFSSAIRNISDVLSVEELNVLPNTKERVIKRDLIQLIQLLWLWLQSFTLKVFNKVEVVGIIIREEEVEVIIIILEEVLTMVVVVIPILISFRISIQSFPLSFRPIIKLSNHLTRIQVNQAGLSVRSVARMFTQLLIVTIEWISHIKGGIHLQNLLLWWLTLLKFKLPMLGLLTQVAQTM